MAGAADAHRTGQITQEDPIGLAGGLNLSGFADGDPVNFSDPFGQVQNAVRGLRDVVPGVNRLLDRAQHVTPEQRQQAELLRQQALELVGRARAALGSAYYRRVMNVAQATTSRFSRGSGSGGVRDRLDE
ncbi:MAG: hypothetical protein ACREMQ_22260 [Longimicrobiales bacterium]